MTLISTVLNREKNIEKIVDYKRRNGYKADEVNTLVDWYLKNFGLTVSMQSSF